MKAIQKIVKQGNSAMVTIPRPMMLRLNWLPGELVVCEIGDDGVLTLRPWRSEQIAQGQSPGVIRESPLAVKA